MSEPKGTKLFWKWKKSPKQESCWICQTCWTWSVWIRGLWTAKEGNWIRCCGLMWLVLDGVQIQVFVIAVMIVWIPALESWPCHAVVRASLEVRFWGFCLEYKKVTVTWVRCRHMRSLPLDTVAISVDALVVVGCQSLEALEAKWCILQTLPLCNHHFDIWYQFQSLDFTGFVSFLGTDVSLMVPNQGYRGDSSQCQVLKRFIIVLYCTLV